MYIQKRGHMKTQRADHHLQGRKRGLPETNLLATIYQTASLQNGMEISVPVV